MFYLIYPPGRKARGGRAPTAPLGPEEDASAIEMSVH